MKNIDINLVCDAEMKKLNAKWFARRRPTDVIAFGYGTDMPHGPLGEIFVSVDAARRQARERFVAVEDELLRLIVHGILHVQGYDDTEMVMFCEMRQKEWEILVSSL